MTVEERGRLLVVAIESRWEMAGYRPDTLRERLSSILVELLVSSHRSTTLRRWLSSHRTDPACFTAANSIFTEIMAHRLKPFEDCLVHATAEVITAQDGERFRLSSHPLLKRVAEAAGDSDVFQGDWTAQDMECQLERELRRHIRKSKMVKSPSSKESVRCSEVEMTVSRLRTVVKNSLSKHRHRSRQVGTYKEYIERLKLQNGQCFLTGVALSPHNVAGALISPDSAFSPENFLWIDREARHFVDHLGLERSLQLMEAILRHKKPDLFKSSQEGQESNN